MCEFKYINMPILTDSFNFSVYLISFMIYKITLNFMDYFKRYVRGHFYITSTSIKTVDLMSVERRGSRGCR